MNWFARIREFLGVFWTSLCNSVDFIHAVESALGFIGRTIEARLINWMQSYIVAPQWPAQPDIPESISMEVSGVGPAFAPFSAVFAEGSHISFDHRDPEYGYIGTLDKPAPDIDLLVDHVLEPTLVLIRDIDFQIRGDGTTIWFRKNPDSIEGIPSATFTDPDTGAISYKYLLIGQTCRDSYSCQPVDCFMDPLLGDFAEAAWKVHMEGATKYNTKRLLAEATNCVICEKSGIVSSFSPWQEQGYVYVDVDGHIYRSALQYDSIADSKCNVQAGQYVDRGEALFGDIEIHDWDETPMPGPDVVPGILVETDAGALWACNVPEGKEAYVVDDCRILPLEDVGGDADSDILAAYKARCAALAKNTNAPYIDIPATVNPYEFVTRKLRKRRASTIILSADTLPPVDAAVQAVREGTPADAMVTVFIKDTTDPVSVRVDGFVTDTGLMGVAEYISVTLAEGEAIGDTVI